MTTSEKLQKINTAVENMITAKRKVDYNTEMLHDMEDGETVQLEITCKGRTFICYRVEGLALYSLVHNIVKIGLEENKTDYEKCERELHKTWKEIRGEA